MNEKGYQYLQSKNSGPIRIMMAERLKLIRLCANKTAEEVAEATGRSIKAVWAWEQGRSQPDADTLIKLRDFYGLRSVGAFFGEDENMGDLLTFDLRQKFEKLSKEGQKKVISYINDLMDNSKYIKTEEPEEAQNEKEVQPDNINRRLRKNKSMDAEDLIKRLKVVEQMRFKPVER